MGATIATGVFTLIGVLVGALATAGTQLYLDKKREQRAASQAKQVVGGELLHAQLTLRAASKGKTWPPFNDIDAYLPTSAWQEHRSRLAGKVDEDLWYRLVIVYANLEAERVRLIHATALPPDTQLPAKEAEAMKQFSYDLGQLRRELSGGGGWLDEIHDEFKPQITALSVSFRSWLDELGDDDLRKDSVINEIKAHAEAIGKLNRDLGGDGVWLSEINTEIERRVNKVNDSSE
jgi:hypothetical protein